MYITYYLYFALENCKYLNISNYLSSLCNNIDNAVIYRYNMSTNN